jgi:type II restriction enzyme
VQLHLPVHLGSTYASARQKSRVITEAWGERNLYCVNCSASRLTRFKANTPASDFLCEVCQSRFQLKSQNRPFRSRILDAAYKKMVEAIEMNQTPNFLALHYEPEKWIVKSLLLIPRFAIPVSAIVRRKPLALHARRHGWEGCFISLKNVPLDARIPLVEEGRVVPPSEVRRRYRRLKPLTKLDTGTRGWTLDVLTTLRSLGKEEFTLSEVYAFDEHLAKLHPRNRYVRPKIRQQLQILRDLGLVEFIGGGRYRLR